MKSILILIFFLIISINIGSSHTIFCKGDMMCMDFMTGCHLDANQCEMIYNFCKRDVGPVFNKNMCLRDMEECLSLGENYEWCTDYWED